MATDVAVPRHCSDCGTPIPHAPAGCDVCVLCDLRNPGDDD